MNIVKKIKKIKEKIIMRIYQHFLKIWKKNFKELINLNKIKKWRAQIHELSIFHLDLSDHIAEDHDVVTQASKQYEYVEDLMFTPVFIDPDLQRIDDPTDRIE